MTESIHKVSEVFGQSRGIPLNYVQRDNVDLKFQESLRSKKHIVVHGSSKQGKTSLRKISLKNDQYILIHCSNKWDIGKLNAQILKQVGFQLIVSNETTLGGSLKVKASIKIPHLFDFGVEDGDRVSEAKHQKPLDLDIYDVNDIIDSLATLNFNKYIILEDFHYLPDQTQKDFAFQLKAFHEMSELTFIIIGVWLENNKLTLLNGDLLGRVFSLNADTWNRDDLNHVIKTGEELLNVHFTRPLKVKIIDHCLGSVFLLQEICKTILENRGIFEASVKKVNLSIKDSNVFEITKKIILEQSGRYESFLRIFSKGREDSAKDLYKLVLVPILEAETKERIRGISFENLTSKISEFCSLEVSENNIMEILNNIESLQRENDVKPRILDFDNSNLHLNIVDRGFIAWLVFQNKDQLKMRVFKSD